MLIFTIFSIFIGFSFADPQIHYLRSILSSTEYTFLNVEIGSKLIVASNDNAEHLKLITAKIGNTLYTLDTLARTTNVDQTQISLTITNTLTLYTTNIDTVTNVLNGYIYITTAEQARDPNFSVYVVSNKLTIEKTNTAGVEKTDVILNVELIQTTNNWFSPKKTAYVSNFKQPGSTNLHILRGIPSSNPTEDDNAKLIFMNPVPLQLHTENGAPYTKQEFFNYVEPLQISSDSWFIKTNGNYSLTIENKWSDFSTYHTNSPTSTGLIMTNSLFDSTNVTFEPTSPKGISGVFLTVNIMQGYDLSVVFFDESSTFQLNFTGHQNMNQATIFTNMSAKRMEVNSPAVPGEFYIQYYVIDGPPVPSTLPPSTVSPTSASTIDGSKTTTIEATTKSGRLFLNSFLVTSVCLFELQNYLLH